MSKARAPTERWVVARHLDRVFQVLTAPALTPDLPDEQRTAALEGGVTAVAITAMHRDESCRAEIEKLLEACDWLAVMDIAYGVLCRSGLLRPAELPEDDIGALVD